VDPDDGRNRRLVGTQQGSIEGPPFPCHPEVRRSLKGGL
jgi:hypothetical protein